MKGAIEKLKTEWPNFKKHGKDCSAAGLSDPWPCYKHVYGEIPLTEAQRKKWDDHKKNKEKKAAKKKKTLTDVALEGVEHAARGSFADTIDQD